MTEEQLRAKLEFYELSARLTMEERLAKAKRAVGRENTDDINAGKELIARMEDAWNRWTGANSARINNKHRTL